MEKKKYTVQEQLKMLNYKKSCTCDWRVNFHNIIVRAIDPKCRAHDTTWQRIKLYLKRKVGSDQ